MAGAFVVGVLIFLVAASLALILVPLVIAGGAFAAWQMRRRMRAAGINPDNPFERRQQDTARGEIVGRRISGDRAGRPALSRGPRSQLGPQPGVLHFQLFEPLPHRRERRRQLGLAKARRDVLRAIPVEGLDLDGDAALRHGAIARNDQALRQLRFGGEIVKAGPPDRS